MNDRDPLCEPLFQSPPALASRQEQDAEADLAQNDGVNRDFPLIQGLVLLFGLIFILINIGVDLTVAALNPRLRHA